jgi:hypothetical protein
VTHAGHTEDRLQDRHRAPVGGDPHHEAAIDLDHVEVQLPQTRQRRIAGAEVVERELRAERPQVGDHLQHLGGVHTPRRLGELDHEIAGLQAARVDLLEEALSVAGSQQLLRGDVDVNGQGEAEISPLPRLLACLRQHPADQLVAGEALLGEVDEGVGPEHPVVGMAPAQQRLRPDDLAARPEVPERLVMKFELTCGHRAMQLGREPGSPRQDRLRALVKRDPRAAAALA